MFPALLSRKFRMSIYLILLAVTCTVCVARTEHDKREQDLDMLEQYLKSVDPSRRTPKQLFQNCTCGQINIPNRRDGRIINGTEVNPPYKYPWMAVLMKNGRFTCGGSLINNKFVLTASQCVLDEDPVLYEVVMGVHNIENIGNSISANVPGEPYIQRRSVSDIIFFGTNSIDFIQMYHIALLELSTPVTFTKQVSPVCLPPNQREYSQPAREGIIMGWGTTELAYKSNILKEAAVQVIGHHQCRDLSALYPRLSITDRHICASAPGKNICLGDAGGPLVVESATSYTQLGVATWGLFCDQDKFPGVFALVSTYVDLIYLNTTGAIYCRNPDSV